MIDRIAPTLRPGGRADGTQRWRSLLFCHWEVPLAPLRAVVPKPLEIDCFAGRAFVGVVPFQMRQVRPAWLPSALAFNFLETNVRTYVVHNNRPGVYFFSLDASSRLAVWAARIGWALPYFHAGMATEVRGDERVYSSRRTGLGSGIEASARHCVRFTAACDSGGFTSLPGTLEHFLIERYLLFVQRRSKIFVGQVHHPPYVIQPALVHEMNDDLVAAAGLPPVDRLPDLAHFSAGVDVEVFGVRSAEWSSEAKATLVGERPRKD